MPWGTRRQVAWPLLRRPPPECRPLQTCSLSRFGSVCTADDPTSSSDGASSPGGPGMSRFLFAATFAIAMTPAISFAQAPAKDSAHTLFTPGAPDPGRSGAVVQLPQGGTGGHHGRHGELSDARNPERQRDHGPKWRHVNHVRFRRSSRYRHHAPVGVSRRIGRPAEQRDGSGDGTGRGRPPIAKTHSFAVTGPNREMLARVAFSRPLLRNRVSSQLSTDPAGNRVSGVGNRVSAATANPRVAKVIPRNRVSKLIVES